MHRVERNKGILKEMSVPFPLRGQNSEIIKPKGLEFPQESHAVRRKSWPQPEAEFASLEEMSQDKLELRQG